MRVEHSNHDTFICPDCGESHAFGHPGFDMCDCCFCAVEAGLAAR